MIAHAYIGTIGMQGPFETMRDGKVDANWAKQHRCVWLAKETAKMATTATGHFIE